MLIENNMTEREAAEHNAAAWLRLTDRELIERSASLGLTGSLHPVENTPGGRLAKVSELEQLRAAADKIARAHTDDQFVDAWIRENRTGDDEFVRFI